MYNYAKDGSARNQLAATWAFAYEVVGEPFELQRHARHGEGAQGFWS
jgi:hypothetical protein